MAATLWGTKSLLPGAAPVSTASGPAYRVLRPALDGRQARRFARRGFLPSHRYTRLEAKLRSRRSSTPPQAQRPSRAPSWYRKRRPFWPLPPRAAPLRGYRRGVPRFRFARSSRSRARGGRRGPDLRLPRRAVRRPSSGSRGLPVLLGILPASALGSLPSRVTSGFSVRPSWPCRSQAMRFPRSSGSNA